MLLYMQWSNDYTTRTVSRCAARVTSSGSTVRVGIREPRSQFLERHEMPNLQLLGSVA